MHISIERSAAMRRSSKRRLGAAAALTALVATGVAVAGGHLSASDEGGGGTPPTPGEQVNDIPTGVEFETPVSGDDELIVTSGSNFDETILTKYLAADGFEVYQGASLDEDVIAGFDCRSPGTGSAGSLTILSSSVELPDGARIKRVHFYGQDNDTADIAVRLRRQEFNTPIVLAPATPTSTRSSQVVDTFTTSGAQTSASVFSGADNLGEITGSFPDSTGPALSGTINRFHGVEVTLQNSAGTNHVFCGIRVDYQVPASTVEAGAEFHPVGPVRVYDSRESSFTPNGVLTPNSNRVIDITDGYDLDGNAIPAQADIVPANATAVTYNITVTTPTGANFTSVTAGDATSFTTSAINFAAGSELANAGTVTISNGEIKLWGGDGPGSVHVIIDITGYYAPGPLPSNMGN